MKRTRAEVAHHYSSFPSNHDICGSILVPRLGWERFAFRQRDVNDFFSTERRVLILVPRSFRTSRFTLGSDVFLLRAQQIKRWSAIFLFMVSDSQGEGTTWKIRFGMKLGIPDSNFNLQQACHKFVMTRVQACSKLAAS
ncbi:hypothetical protein AVEN_138968-1 [Araneus ventricosus]|uniref:Uncharacterized protein n=1 Tax=Araneus ventricosus TaxID=182803 RepID=A0A4Y2VZD8_ARAVE|nr:hypothetical protein AVEN_138968-1 [Araneus ventricosus]